LIHLVFILICGLKDHIFIKVVDFKLTRQTARL